MVAFSKITLVVASALSVTAAPIHANSSTPISCLAIGCTDTAALIDIPSGSHELTLDTNFSKRAEVSLTWEDWPAEAKQAAIKSFNDQFELDMKDTQSDYHLSDDDWDEFLRAPELQVDLYMCYEPVSLFSQVESFNNVLTTVECALQKEGALKTNYKCD